MLPQGSAVLNVDVFSGIHERISGCASCDELTQIVNEAYASIEATVAAINSQIAALEPLLALLSAPGADLSAIVSWITGLINNFLTPLLKPYTIYPEQLAQIAIQMAELPALIEVKMSEFPSCSVPIPSLPGLP